MTPVMKTDYKVGDLVIISSGDSEDCYGIVRENNNDTIFLIFSFYDGKSAYHSPFSIRPVEGN